MTNFFDAGILHLLNGFAHRSESFDFLVMFLQNDGFQKGGLVIALVWWVWFQPSKEIQEHREKLICILLVSPFALALSRLISFLAPFRIRPIHNPELNLRLAYGLSGQTLINWSSFPSDHAVLFFTFAVGLFLVSRKMGAIAIAYVTLFIAIPRVYLGVHYPTDMLAGALLGAGTAYVATLPFNRIWIGARALRWMERSPAAFYVFLFVSSYQVANAFGWARDVVVFARQFAPSLFALK
jgi:undecaprenyl-diphosphatase